MKFRGHRRAAFKRSYRPTTSNSEVDGWGWQCPSPDSQVNLQAIRPLRHPRLAPGADPSYTNGGIRSWQTALRSTIRRSSSIWCKGLCRQERQVTSAAAGEHYCRRWRWSAQEISPGWSEPPIETSLVCARLSLTRRFNIAFWNLETIRWLAQPGGLKALISLTRSSINI